MSIKAYLGGIKAAFTGSSYTSANTSRFRNYYGNSRSTDVTEDRAMGTFGRQQTRLECRDLYRNDPIVKGAVSRFVDYTVGAGIWPQAQTSDTAWNDAAESWWKDIYVPTADYRQIPGVDLITLQGLTISHRIIDGGIGFIMLDNGQLQPVEEGLIKTPTKLQSDKSVQAGVKLGKGGIVQGYFVCERNGGDGTPDAEKFKFVPRENFIYCPNLTRAAQYRGIPVLAPAVAKLRDYAETSEYVLNKVKIDGEQQFKRFTKSGLPNERNRNASYANDTDGKDPLRTEKTSWGRVHNLMVGEDMAAFDSATPNSQYVGFMEHELRAIASCLGISYEYLMLIFTQGSFSSQRMSLLATKRTFDNNRNWLIKCQLQRLWNWRIAKAMKAGVLPPAPLVDGVSQWWRVDWSLVHMDRADPQKQQSADKDKFNMGLTSLKSLARSQGRDRDDILREKAGDLKRADEIAKEVGVDPARMIETGTPGLQQGSSDEAPEEDQDEVVARKTKLQFESLKAKYDAYGVGVRAGAITPQEDDEQSFREESGLPATSEAVGGAWEEDKGFRRPITLAPPNSSTVTEDLFEDDGSDDDSDSDNDEDTD